jgi:hypothetical protein
LELEDAPEDGGLKLKDAPEDGGLELKDDCRAWTP